MTATILIVDDLEANIKLLEAKLLSEYYTVITANNGVNALKILEQSKIDIILLDVMMPVIDGFEICMRIKSNPKTTHIPVIMVTALSEIEDRVKGLEAGADEFLTKPINDISLLARVKSLNRMKALSDELQSRNDTLLKLGRAEIIPKENFFDSKILLLDDDIIQAKNTKKCLTSFSAHLKIISSLEGVDSLGPFIPDVIIISCQMEDIDPLRVVAMLRSKPMLRNSILMFLAEDENSPMVIKGLDIGINDYITYPVDKSELQARLKTQLRRKNYQDNLRSELDQSVDLSTKDGLTGLFNRRYFDIHIKQMSERLQASGKDMCMMMLDMDHFKKVNDNYGHTAGDALLKTLANILKELFRVTDLIARYGGEEFVILMGNTKLKDCIKIAEKIRITVENIDFIVPGQDKPLEKTISIGVAQLEKNESVESFINRADEAMYKAKKLGRNKICY